MHKEQLHPSVQKEYQEMSDALEKLKIGVFNQIHIMENKFKEKYDVISTLRKEEDRKKDIDKKYEERKIKDEEFKKLGLRRSEAKDLNDRNALKGLFYNSGAILFNGRFAVQNKRDSINHFDGHLTYRFVDNVVGATISEYGVKTYIVLFKGQECHSITELKEVLERNKVEVINKDKKE